MDNGCCLSAADACYKRVGRQFNQCRPLPRDGTCESNADWLCPHLAETPHAQPYAGNAQLPARAPLVASETASGNGHTTPPAAVVDHVGTDAGQRQADGLHNSWPKSSSGVSETTGIFTSDTELLWLVVSLAALVVVCCLCVGCIFLFVRRRIEGPIGPKLEARGIGRRVRHTRLRTGEDLEQVNLDLDDVGDDALGQELEGGAVVGSEMGPAHDAVVPGSMGGECRPANESATSSATSHDPNTPSSVEGKAHITEEERLLQRVAELLQDERRPRYDTPSTD